jgi:hypothetical protein
MSIRKLLKSNCSGDEIPCWVDEMASRSQNAFSSAACPDVSRKAQRVVRELMKEIFNGWCNLKTLNRSVYFLKIPKALSFNH